MESQDLVTEPPEAEDRPVVGSCHECSETLYEGDEGIRPFTAWSDPDRNDYLICADCFEHAFQCDRCSTFTDSTASIRWRNDEWCYPCLTENAAPCYDCDEWTWLNDLRNEQCSSCWSCECWECDCRDCYPDGCDCCGSSEWIYDYSYKPYARFFSTDADGTVITPGNVAVPNQPYLGMELEISIDDAGHGAQLVTEAGRYGLIYCKADSTVEGFEMVTHPMTLEAAKAALPFETLRTLRNDYRASGYDNGIHVHVSRSGFDNDAHVYKWMKLIYRNEDDVTRIARRDSTEWASFDNDTRQNHKRLAKKRGTSDSFYSARYSAINCQNRDTFEVRVFRGSLRQDEILASLELVAASVEYTRQLSASDVLKADGWSWAAFMSWADAQGIYGDLVGLDNRTKSARVGVIDATNQPTTTSDAHRCGCSSCQVYYNELTAEIGV